MEQRRRRIKLHRRRIKFNPEGRHGGPPGTSRQQAMEERQRKRETLWSLTEIFSYMTADELRIIRDRIKEELLFAYFYSGPVYLYPTFFHTDERAKIIDLPKPNRLPRSSEAEWCIPDQLFRRLLELVEWACKNIKSLTEAEAAVRKEAYAIVRGARFRDPAMKQALAQR